MLIWGWNHKITGEELKDQHKHVFHSDFTHPKHKIGQRVLALSECIREVYGEKKEGMEARHCYVVGSFIKDGKRFYQTMESPVSPIKEFIEHRILARD